MVGPGLASPLSRHLLIVPTGTLGLALHRALVFSVRSLVTVDNQGRNTTAC